jgi:hypothetical protein
MSCDVVSITIYGPDVQITKKKKPLVVKLVESGYSVHALRLQPLAHMLSTPPLSRRDIYMRELENC